MHLTSGDQYVTSDINPLTGFSLYVMIDDRVIGSSMPLDFSFIAGLGVYARVAIIAAADMTVGLLP
jgi:hypothetical protein